MRRPRMGANQHVPHTIDLRGQDDLLYIPIGFVEYGSRGAVRDLLGKTAY